MSAKPMATRVSPHHHNIRAYAPSNIAQRTRCFCRPGEMLSYAAIVIEMNENIALRRRRRRRRWRLQWHGRRAVTDSGAHSKRNVTD